MATERFIIVVQAKGLGTAESGMDRFSRSTGRAEKNVNALRKSLAFLRSALVVVASIRVFGGLIRTLATFSQEMSTVKAITGATQVQFQQLRQEAKNLGATTRFSATEAAQGMTFLARAGFDVNQVLAAIGPTLLLAQAGNLSLARAADIASNVLQSFGLQADQTAKVVDVLAKAANSSNTNVQQLGDALKLVAPVASGFGLNVEKTAAAVGVLSNTGLQATLAGTGLRRVLGELETGGKKLEAVLAGTGVKVKDVRISSVGLVTALKNLKKTGIDPASFALQVFGQRGGPAFLNLIKNIPQLEQLNLKLKDAAGFAKQTADIMDDNLNGALLAVRSAAENLLITFGDIGAESFLTRSFRALADLLRTLAANIDRVIQALETLALIVLPKLIAATTVWAAKLALANKALFALTAAVTIVSALSAAFDDAGKSVDDAGANTRTFTQRVLADFQTIGDFVSGVFSDISGTAQDVWTIIRTTGARAFKSLELFAQAFWFLFKRLGLDAINFVIRQLNALLGGLNSIASLTGQKGFKLIDEVNVKSALRATIEGGKKLADEFKRLGAERDSAFLRIADRARVARRLREANQLASQNIRGGETDRLAQILRPGAPKPRPDPGRRFNTDSSRGAKKLADELDRVLGRSNSARKALIALKNAEDVLNRAVAAGLINRKDANKVLDDYKRKLDDALHPLNAVVRKIGEERDLLKLSNADRAVESELLKVINEHRKQGVFFTEKEIDGLRQLIRLREEEKRVAGERESLRDQILGPQQRFDDQTKALTQLRQEGKLTTSQLQDASRGIRLSFLNTQKDIFSGFERGFLKMEADVADAAKSTEELFNLAFSGATDAIIKFAETGKFEISGLLRDIGKMLLQLGLKQAFVGGGNLLGLGSGVSNGGAGIGGLLSGLLGGSTSGGGGGGGGIGGLLTGLLGFASGGSFRVGANTAVGSVPGVDNRLVAFRAQDGEDVTITPRGGGGQRPVTINYYITTPDADSFRRSQGQVLASTSAALNRANARNN